MPCACRCSRCRLCRRPRGGRSCPAPPLILPALSRPPPLAHPPCGAGMMGTSRSLTSLQPAPRLVVERRWRLGLCSRAHPSSIMQASLGARAAPLRPQLRGPPSLPPCSVRHAPAAPLPTRRRRPHPHPHPHPPTLPQELYRTLQYCGVAWKKNGAYNLKCRAVLRLSATAGRGDGAPPNGAAGAAGGLPREASDDSMGVAMEASPAAAGGQQQGGLAAALAAEDARMAEAAAAVVGSGGGSGAARAGPLGARARRAGAWALNLQLHSLPAGFLGQGPLRLQAAGDSPPFSPPSARQQPYALLQLLPALPTAPPAAAASLEREVKFEAQLYKMRDGEYSLDFQVRSCGPACIAGCGTVAARDAERGMHARAPRCGAALAVAALVMLLSSALAAASCRQQPSREPACRADAAAARLCGSFSAARPTRHAALPPLPRLQRLSGDLFLFMDTCSSLLSVLRL